MSSLPIRFALATTPQSGEAAMNELRQILARVEDCEVEPVFVPNYSALYDDMHLHDADVGWCPPLVARDLQRDGAADPRLCIMRGESAHYFSAIVGKPTLHDPSEIRRFGWVSRMSAAGYLVPRSYLASVGIDMSRREERFFHTHARSMMALQAGAVDAIATYAIRDHSAHEARVPHAFPGARLLATMGPIPGDVIMLAHSIPAPRARAIVDALRSAKLPENSAITALMGATSFGDVPANHLESLSRWIALPVFSRVPGEAH